MLNTAIQQFLARKTRNRRSQRRRQRPYPVAAEVLEARLLLTDFDWTGPNGSVWGDGANWENVLTMQTGTTPGAADLANTAPVLIRIQNAAAIDSLVDNSAATTLLVDGGNLEGKSLKVGTNQTGVLHLLESQAAHTGEVAYEFSELFIQHTGNNDNALFITDTDAYFGSILVADPLKVTGSSQVLIDDGKVAAGTSLILDNVSVLNVNDVLELETFGEAEINDQARLEGNLLRIGSINKANVTLNDSGILEFETIKIGNGTDGGISLRLNDDSSVFATDLEIEHASLLVYGNSSSVLVDNLESGGGGTIIVVITPKGN